MTRQEVKNIECEFGEWKKYIHKKKQESLRRLRNKAQNELKNFI